MDISTLTQLISVGKEFLGGGDSGDGGLPQAKEYRPDFDKYKRGVDSYGYARQEELAEPGEAAMIQQVSYKQTQQFWDNYLRDYMGDI
jgi:hypothetical protein